MALPASRGCPAPVPSIDNFASALDRANRALAAAKQNGCDCVVVARPGAGLNDGRRALNYQRAK